MKKFLVLMLAVILTTNFFDVAAKISKKISR